MSKLFCSEEAMRYSGLSAWRNSGKIENQVFNKLRKEEEYVEFIGRLIQHIREMSKYRNLKRMLVRVVQYK